MAPTTSSRTTAIAKPYDRLSSSKAKGKAPAASSGVNIGAPSTLGQASRKGKKAWRKNIDIADVEEALERGREEERLTGGTHANKSNTDLFTVDIEGDVEVGKKARRTHKPLRSLAVLSERSAVPSLTSRPTKPSSSSNAKTKTHLSRAEKERLRRLARRQAADSDGQHLGSADVRTDGPAEYDAWTRVEVQPVAKGGFGEETMVVRKPKAPKTIEKQRMLYLSAQVESGRAVEKPDGGTSYNPTAESHAKLINEAYQEELALLRKEKEAEELVEMRGGVVEARRAVVDSGEFAPGMTVGAGDPNGDSESDSGSESEGAAAEGRTKKASKRKTQAQRNKALRHRLSVQAAKDEAARRKLSKSVMSVHAFKRELEKKAREEKEKERLSRFMKSERERLGLKGGEKVGKHRVAKGKVDVQLGEDLAESLRQIKPEGNLFKDRFLALQKRALIEPRVPQMPKRRTTRTKEYEQHSYKRFQ